MTNSIKEHEKQYFHVSKLWLKVIVVIVLLITFVATASDIEVNEITVKGFINVVIGMISIIGFGISWFSKDIEEYY